MLPLKQDLRKPPSLTKENKKNPHPPQTLDISWRKLCVPEFWSRSLKFDRRNKFTISGIYLCHLIPNLFHFNQVENLWKVAVDTFWSIVSRSQQLISRQVAFNWINWLHRRWDHQEFFSRYSSKKGHVFAKVDVRTEMIKISSFMLFFLFFFLTRLLSSRIKIWNWRGDRKENRTGSRGGKR